MSERLESMWNPYEFHYSIWNPCGTVVEYISWFHMESRWKFHMEWWNPHGIHIIPSGFHMGWNNQNGWDFTQNIFHMEWVESIWNDMDSTWNPCGMWGEGKDLVVFNIYRISSPMYGNLVLTRMHHLNYNCHLHSMGVVGHLTTCTLLNHVSIRDILLCGASSSSLFTWDGSYLIQISSVYRDINHWMVTLPYDLHDNTHEGKFSKDSVAVVISRTCRNPEDIVVHGLLNNKESESTREPSGGKNIENFITKTWWQNTTMIWTGYLIIRSNQTWSFRLWYRPLVVSQFHR